MAKSLGAGNTGNNPYARKSSNGETLRLRRVKAMEGRLAGKTYRVLAEELGVNPTRVREDVQILMAEYMREHEADTIPRYRAIELQRLDDGLVEVYKIMKSRSGTELALKAVDRLARLVNLRSELLGLKVPIEVNLKKVELTQADLELEEIVREAEVQAEIQRQAILEEAEGGPA